MLRRAVILVAGLVLVWLVAAIALFVVHHGDKPIRANAVFVLSGSRKRLPVGVKLVREGYAPLLVVSRTLQGGPSELETRACTHKLDLRVLCVSAKPYSTMGEAELLARLATERGWRAVDVVTSEYHVIRARILMKRCFHGQLAVVGAPDELTLLVPDMVLESVKLVYHELFRRAC